MRVPPKCVLFNGLGGAGQRHLRILRELLPDAQMVGARSRGTTPVLNPDFSIKKGATLENEYGIELFNGIDEAYALKPDLAVIATPTAFHADHIIQAVKNGVDVLVEKPGAMNLSQALEVISTVKMNRTRFFISYQRRFHPLIIRLREILRQGGIGALMSVRASIASYVPDWHPYEDFRDLYACRADLGGGVLRTEIHEIDLVTWLLGEPVGVHAVLGCRGPYDIGVEDSADLLLDYDNFVVQLSLCFMQRKQERVLKFTGQDGWVEIDLVAQRLEVGRHDSSEVRVYKDAVENDELFCKQANYFLSKFDRNDYTYLDALEKNMSVIEKSMDRTT